MLLARAYKDTTTLISLHRDLSSTETDLRNRAQLSHDLLKEHLTACPFAGLRIWRKRTDNKRSGTAAANSVETVDTNNNYGEATKSADKIEDICPVCSAASNIGNDNSNSNSSSDSVERPLDDRFGNIIMSMPLSTSPPFERRVRTHAESPEEVALRRRRREAIVLNDGDRPFVQGDIIQRGVHPNGRIY